MTLQTAERIAHIAQTTAATIASVGAMALVILPLHSGLSWPVLALLWTGGIATGLAAGVTVMLLLNNPVSLWLYGIELAQSDEIEVIDLDLDTTNTQE